MIMLVMLLLDQVYVDLDKVDDYDGGNSAIPIGGNIGDDHVGCGAVFMLITGLQVLVYISIVYSENCSGIHSNQS